MSNHPQTPFSAFTSKAEKYARYRWDYAPQAIATLFDVTQITELSTVADIGAGTGILTRHFIGKVARVYAIEPNLEMRQQALQRLGDCASCQFVAGCAEETSLPENSVDLITAATAMNWFDPQPTRAEFLRILKPGGWLAILKNYSTDREVGEALGKVYPAETDTGEIMKGLGTPSSFYYGGSDYLKYTFDFTTRATWEEFFGALSTASYAPDEGSPYHPAFEAAARQVFERFNTGGLMVSHGVTELNLGQLK